MTRLLNILIHDHDGEKITIEIRRNDNAPEFFVATIGARVPDKDDAQVAISRAVGAFLYPDLKATVRDQIASSIDSAVFDRV